MASDQNLILEIEEALKREKTEKLFKEYGPYILIGSLLAVLFTGAISGYRSWETRVNAENTAVLMQALTQQDQVKALTAVAPELRPGQRAIAQMTAAGVLVSQDKKTEAHALYTQVAEDKALPAIYRDLAALTVVRLTLSGDTKAADAGNLLAKLQPLLDKKNPWHNQARIESALISAHLQNDYKAAREHLAPVIAEGDKAPASVIQRARALEQVFGQKMSAAKPDTSAPKSPDAEG